MTTTILILIIISVIIAGLNLFFLYVNTKVLEMLYNVIMKDAKLTENNETGE